MTLTMFSAGVPFLAGTDTAGAHTFFPKTASAGRTPGSAT